MKKARKHIPNPLFEQWITEWYERAKSENNPTQYGYAKALRSLQKCPLKFSTGMECYILQHFCTKLCLMLDKKLAEHKKLLKCNNHTSNQNQDLPSTSKEPPQNVTEKKASQNWMENKNFHTVLMTLYQIKNKKSDYVTLKELKKEMLQYYKDSSELQDGSLSSVLTELLNNSLVDKISPPLRYKISDQGILNVEQFTKKSNSESSNKNDCESSFVKFSKEIEESELQIKPSRNSTKFIKIFDEVKQLMDQNSNKNKNDIAAHNKKDTTSNIVTSTKNVPEPALLLTEANKDNLDKIADVENDFDHFVLEPNSFDVILLVDIHETNQSKPENDVVISKLTSTNTNFLIRHLNVGDFAWIARCKKTQKELVLPYVAERKRVDDLSSSIKDGRFHEQKFRLKRSGIHNKIYLVEGLNKSATTGIPLTSLFQASINSLVQDGFALKYTQNQKDSVMFLSILTKSLKNKYKEKRLISCRKEDLDSKKDSKNAIYLMAFDEFNKSSSKVKTLRVQEMFVRQLAQMKGLSIDKALAIVKLYPTPLILQKALSEGDENSLSNVKVGSGKQTIGATLSQIIYKLYINETLN